MKGKIIVLASLAFLYGCEADVDAPVDADINTNSNVTINNYGDINSNGTDAANIVENLSDLPKCSIALDGKTYTILSSGKKALCKDGEWDYVSSPSKEEKPTATSSNSSEKDDNKQEDNSSSSQTTQSDDKSSSSQNAQTGNNSSTSQTTNSGLLFNGADGTGADKVNLGNGVYGMWGAYHDEFSYFTWPAGTTVEDNKGGSVFVDFVINSVNQFKAIKGDAYYHRTSSYYTGYIGFIFDFIKDDSRILSDITTWGGICVEYVSDRNFTLVVASSDARPPYATIPAQTSKKVKDISWSEFSSASTSITSAIKSAIRLGFQFGETSAASTTSFVIYKIGKYGTCN